MGISGCRLRLVLDYGRYAASPEGHSTVLWRRSMARWKRLMWYKNSPNGSCLWHRVYHINNVYVYVAAYKKTMGTCLDLAILVESEFRWKVIDSFLGAQANWKTMYHSRSQLDGFGVKLHMAVENPGNILYNLYNLLTILETFYSNSSKCAS